MTGNALPGGEEKGLGARQFVLMFLAGVAVCAVFFAAGFLVGYNERATHPATATEQVTPAGEVPPTVNSPAAAAPSEEKPARNPKAENPPAAGSSVREQNLPGASRASAPLPGHAAEGAYWVQVAASSSRQEADRVVHALKGKGYPASLESARQAGAKDNLFRIRVGPFVTREQAEQTRGSLEHDGFKKPFIKH